MATLIELFNKRNDSNFRNQVAAACWNEAKNIFVELDTVDDHIARLVWAKAAFADNGGGLEIQRVFIAVNVLLQDNATPTDTEIQNAAIAAVAKFAV